MWPPAQHDCHVRIGHCAVETHAVKKAQSQSKLELGTHPERLSALRQRLAQQRIIASLFNTARFTRHLESAYTQMHHAHRQGLSPRSFHVAALD